MLQCRVAYLNRSSSLESGWTSTSTGLIFSVITFKAGGDGLNEVLLVSD